MDSRPTEGPGGEGRWRSVQRLIESLQAYQDRTREPTLKDYIQMVTLDRSQVEDGEEPTDQVLLMSMHGSKGLEWPVCFVVGCEEGLLPHQRVIDENGDVAEERRLFYVAMTRARRRLFLTRARQRKRFRGSVPTRPSRFLAELPEQHLDTEDRQFVEDRANKEEVLDRFAALKARLANK